MNLDSLKNFDWRSLKKFTDPKAADDLNAFLEKLPANAGQTMLIIAGVAWSCAGAAGLYTTVQLQQLTELRAELEEAEALKPVVPVIKDVPVNAQAVSKFVENTQSIYGDLEIRPSGAAVTITANNTALFGQFREAVGHVQNGGSGWRVNVERLCVGRECKPKSLAATLKINTVSVETPG